VTAPSYQGMCIGGPLKGRQLSHFRPSYELALRTNIIAIGEAITSRTYHYVPLWGMMGFWLYEEETKGKGPYDDIMRLLCENYMNANKEETQG
jgi:hypothetical protein